MENVLASHPATEKLKVANLHKLTTEPQFDHEVPTYLPGKARFPQNIASILEMQWDMLVSHPKILALGRDNDNYIHS